MDFGKSARPYLAELIGTFVLTFIGAGSIASGQNNLVGIALAHGLAIMTMIYAMGHISGVHLNPAVTISLLAGGKIKPADAVGYIISQLIGATLAGFALLVIYPDPVKAAFLGTPALGANVGVQTAIFVEAVMTFFLALAVWGSGVDAGHPAPLSEWRSAWS